MKHLDLFSGIGGFALAARLAGLKTIGFSEIDPYACAVLKKNFPNIKNYGDIKQITRETLVERVDIITGGFPCQPFSVAGKRKGKTDDRHLWPEMLRVIKEFKPAWVLGENVAGFISMALDGAVADLEAEGYEVQPIVIPACAVGAPHRRDRVWIIAHSEHSGRNCSEDTEGIRARTDDNTPREKAVKQPSGFNSQRSTTDSSEQRLQGHYGETRIEQTHTSHWSENWYEAATSLCRVDDWLPNRVDRIKCLGNAIVPQVAYEILKLMN